jgi:hypothetical protein
MDWDKYQTNYPVTLVLDRYGGVYSGGIWLAFEADPHAIPEAIWGGDGECMEFWEHHDSIRLPIGKGASPEEAILSLAGETRHAEVVRNGLNPLIQCDSCGYWHSAAENPVRHLRARKASI